MCYRLLAGAAAMALLAGCETVHPQSGSTDPGFGEAVKYDMAIQVIDPDPVYTAEDSQPGDSGAKGAAAVQRYRTDRVKEVQTQATTSGSGGDSSGAGPR